MKRGITRRTDLQLVADLAVQCRQRVEWHRREGVMFGVVGHIPHQKPDQRITADGSGIAPHVARFVAPAMLGHQIEPQEGLSHKCGNQPQPK